MPSILLADDHQLVRDTVAAYLAAKGGFNVQSAATAQEALEVLSSQKQIDLAILDYEMPGMNGLDGLAELKRHYPDQKTALISGVATSDVAEKAMHLGAVAYFPKSMPVASMLDGIRQLLVSECGPQQDPDTIDGSSPQPRDYGLTSREEQVLARLTLGQSNKVIAEELRLKEVTVKFHITNILSKLGVSNRTQAALLASTEKLI
ncbi:MAG: response regulator transcription factor [Dinoroseobacter sp.]|nr:response regulator transcription factor [Dinoroseobacter sp.]